MTDKINYSDPFVEGRETMTDDQAEQAYGRQRSGRSGAGRMIPEGSIITMQPIGSPTEVGHYTPAGTTRVFTTLYVRGDANTVGPVSIAARYFTRPVRDNHGVIHRPGGLSFISQATTDPTVVRLLKGRTIKVARAEAVDVVYPSGPATEYVYQWSDITPNPDNKEK